MVLLKNGMTDIYNPWSVIQYIDDARANTIWLPMAYWANTSSNGIARTLIDHSDDDNRMQIEELLVGVSMYKSMRISRMVRFMTVAIIFGILCFLQDISVKRRSG